MFGGVINPHSVRTQNEHKETTMDYQKPTLIQDLGMLYPNEKSKQKKRMGIYECPFCKKHFKSFTYKINKKLIMSCGCYRRKLLKRGNIKHGMSKERLYKILLCMKDRCYNKNHQSYIHYGGKGVSICKEWENYSCFKDWALKNGYNGNLSIDRIDVNGNYEPNNCRWVNQSVQTRNSARIRSTNKTGYRGVSKRTDYDSYTCRITVNYKRITLGTFKTKIEAAKAYDKYIIDNNLEHTKNFS